MFTKKKLEMFEDQYGLHFSFDWLTPGTYFLAFFSVLWMGFLAFWYTNALANGASGFFLLFPILHLLAGLFMMYTTVTQFFNKTSIDLIDDELTIKHGPVPWFKGDESVNVNEIQQFYVKELKEHTEDGTYFNYGIWGILGNGTRLDLTKGVTMDSDYALMVEQKLENYLGIEDRPIKGAYGNTNKAKSLNDFEEDAEPTLDLEDLKKRPDPEIQKRDNWDEDEFV